MLVGDDLQWHVRLLSSRLERFFDAKVTGQDHDELFRTQPFNVFFQNGSEVGASIFASSRREFVVMNRDTLLKELIPKMAHRAKKKRDTHLVAPDMRGLLVDFGHPDRILFGVEGLGGC